MKKQLLLFLTTILSFSCYSQISFEKGYYIDNKNQKINCLIKNVDWKNNPIEFEYKLSENSESNKKTIKSVKEFGIDNISKYIRSSIKIDRSSNNINNLSYDRIPKFKEEELFLKVLIAGKITLYEYIDGNLRKFFYGKENSDIEQLVFKRYKTSENKIGQNYRYKQQLWNNLKCPNFKRNKIKSLDYKKIDLVNFFIEYNNCNNQEYLNFEEKQKRDLFNLTIRPRLNNSSLVIQNSISDIRNTNFDNKIGFGFGVEAEMILPFNKNKWSIAIEPTLINFNSEKSSKSDNVSGGIIKAKVNYNSLEIPISLRHYLFLKNNDKVFINASFIFDFSSKSSIEFARNDDSVFSSLDINTSSNFALGFGYKHDKYSAEIRYQSPKEILTNYVSWNTEYQTLSIIFGYSLF